MLRTMSAIVLAVAVTGCGGKKIVEPTGGDLTISYAGPSSTDGAIMLRISGAVDAVKSIGSLRTVSGDAGAGATRVIVTGDLTTGDLFRIAVKDVSLNYSVQVEAVADRNTYALGDPSSYTASVRK